MRILHAFDLYLPATFSWMHRMLLWQEQRAVIPEIAAFAVLDNAFSRSSLHLRFHEMLPGLRFRDEFSAPAIRRLLQWGARRTAMYRRFLYARLKDDPPDLVHAHFGPTAVYFFPLARALGIPLLASFYGFDYTSFILKRPEYAGKYRDMFRLGAFGSAGTREGLRRLAELGCPTDAGRRLPFGVDPEEFALAARRSRSGPLRFVQLAAFTGKKGQMDSVRAFHKALPALGAASLHLAGEVIDRDVCRQVKAYLARYALEERIILDGFVPREEVPGYLNRFDVLLHPSKHTASGDHEDVPVVILEAMAAGLPVISTRHFGIPEVVLHDETGFLAEEGDVEALAAYLIRLAGMSPTALAAFGAAARRRVAERFSMDRSGAAHLAFYREIIENRSRP